MNDFWESIKDWLPGIITILLVAVLIISLVILAISTSPGGEFDYAIISYGDGVSLKIEIASYSCIGEHHLQILSKAGTVYLVHPTNCILVKEGE